jgi:hypothetical protein
MGKKYIKSKDGKFQGSVSDGKSIPSAGPTKLPSMPSTAKESPEREYQRVSQLYAAKMSETSGESAGNAIRSDAWRAETAGNSLFVNDKVHTITGTVSETPQGRFLGSVDVSYVDREESVDSRVFDDPYEAENWVSGEVNSRADEMYDFQQAYSYDPAGVESMADKVLNSNPQWHEEKHEVFGNHIGFMRAPQRGATVQRLGESGHLVMVHDYKSANDEDGQLYIQQHFPNFETAWAYARHLCAKKI